MSRDKYLIILINYNNWTDTAECIDSLLNSGVGHSSIVVIDNYSINDSYYQLTSRYSGIEIVRTDSNIGFSGGNNLGIKLAIERNLEYVILLNNDTLVDNNSIPALILEMDRHPEAVLGTGHIRYYPEKERIWYAGGRLIPWRGLAVHFKKGEIASPANETVSLISFISGCYLCIRLNSIEKLGFLEEKFFLYLEDIEYSARAFNKGLKQLYVPQSVIYHKSRGDRELRLSTLYYSVRNRKLLIEKSFPSSALYYFNVVISMKLIYWYFTNKKAFRIARAALSDYKNGKFGQIYFDYNNI